MSLEHPLLNCYLFCLRHEGNVVEWRKIFPFRIFCGKLKKQNNNTLIKISKT